MVSKWVFMRLMATSWPFLMHVALSTSEKVPSPFLLTILYSAGRRTRCAARDLARKLRESRARGGGNGGEDGRGVRSGLSFSATGAVFVRAGRPLFAGKLHAGLRATAVSVEIEIEIEISAAARRNLGARDFEIIPPLWTYCASSSRVVFGKKRNPFGKTGITRVVFRRFNRTSRRSGVEYPAAGGKSGKNGAGKGRKRAIRRARAHK